MPFAVDIPDGWFAVRNPHYPQDSLFEDSVRRATISEADGVDAIFSPLAEDGRFKARYVLFDESKWTGPDSCNSWVREHRDALKFRTPEGTPRVWAREKTAEVAVLKAFGPTPSERDLDRINSYAIEPLSVEDVYVRHMRLCNTQVDRAFERFTERNLRQISKSIVGKSVMLAHNYSQTPQGRYFDSSVQKSDGIAHAVPEFYIVRSAPSAAEAIPQIDGGVWKDVSVGFSYEAIQCDLCGGDYLDYNSCPHLAGSAYPQDQVAALDRNGFEVLRDGREAVCTVNYGSGQVEGLEGSLGVWLGCQYDADVVKARRLMFGDPHESKAAQLERTTWTRTKTISIPSGKQAASKYGPAVEQEPEPEPEPKASKESDAEKMVPTLEDLPLDRDGAWSWSWADDADAIVESGGWAALGSVCLFVDKTGDEWPEQKNRYWGPHGKLKGGTLTTYFRGCSAALVRLRGAGAPAFGSTEAGEAHIRRHYEKFDEEFPVRANGAPAQTDGKGAPMPDESPDIETQLTETTKAFADEKQAHDETKAAMADLEARLKSAEAERDSTKESLQALRSKAEEEVAWYAQQLKLDDTLEALAGESGLAGLTAEKLLELRESWRGKYEATLPPRMQSEHEVRAPEADPTPQPKHGEPITDPQALRASRM